MATVPRKGEFYDTESGSGEWAGDEQVGDGTTREQRVAAARAPGYDDSDKRQAAAASAPTRAPTRPGQSSSGRKPAVVTKEQLEKSGFTNLRDYMNDKAKLKRRDGKAPERRADAAAPEKGKTASEYSQSSDDMRNLTRQKAAFTRSPLPAIDLYTDRMKNKSRKEARFEGAKRMAKTPEAQAKRKAMEKGQALERVTPEEYLLPGASLKALHKQAAKLAKPKIMEYNPKMLPAPKAAPKADVKALEAPRQRLNYDKKGALEARREAKDVRLKNEVAEENAKRYGLDPKAPGYDSTAKAVRDKMGGKEFTFKKGGRVSASKMGSSSSSGAASKRADGIAQRGKTRCRVY